MAYIPRSSFIPKETSGAIPMQAKKRQTVHLFSLISTILLVCSLVGVGGIFLFKGFLNKQLDGAKVSLNAVSSNKDTQKKMEEIQLYDNRLTVAQSLLDNHIAPSRIFSLLEGSTKETIQFQSLEFTYDPGFEATLTLGGNTKEFSSVALQKMQFIKDELFSNFIVQGISSASEDSKTGKTGEVVSVGKVKFSVKGVFKQESMSYTGMSVDSGSVIEEIPESTPTVVEPFVPATPPETTNEVMP